MTLKESVGTALLATAVVALSASSTTAQTAGASKPVAAKPDQKANADAIALQDFKKRVDGYVSLHKKVAKDVPPMKPTENPAEIAAAKDALANGIREARAGARAGDIFTPEVRAAFRKILRPELKGEDGKHAKEILEDDAPTGVKLQANSKYPETATRPTAPAAILTNLPQLPSEVEYRFIDKHLLLVDTKALLIVDFIPNAIP